MPSSWGPRCPTGVFTMKVKSFWSLRISQTTVKSASKGREGDRLLQCCKNSLYEESSQYAACYATDTWQCCQLCTVSVYKQALQPTYTEWSPSPPVSTSDAERPPGKPVNTRCWLASISVYLTHDTVSHQTFIITVRWQYAHRFSWSQAAPMANKMQFTKQFEQVTINFHNHNYLSSIIIFPCHFMPH
jgi:hypothetical protein